MPEDEGVLTTDEVVGEVLRSERLFRCAQPLAQSWLGLKEREAVGYERTGWGCRVGMRVGLLFAVCLLVWHDKIPKGVAATILGGIASALFMERRKSP